LLNFASRYKTFTYTSFLTKTHFYNLSCFGDFLILGRLATNKKNSYFLSIFVGARKSAAHFTAEQLPKRYSEK